MTSNIPTTFLEKCALVCVDIQEGGPPVPLTEDKVPALWKSLGISVEDVNAANQFFWETGLPHAVRVVNACRLIHLPMIFIHWGYLFEDGMDLDPDVRCEMIKEHGYDFSKWNGYIKQTGSQPAKIFNIQKGEYVLPKTAQDAFSSSNIHFLLKNLDVRNLVMIGGHTEACLGKTAQSAKNAGYHLMCVVDATNNARESTRLKGIEAVGYDYLVTTQEFEELVQSWLRQLQAKTSD